MEKTKKKKIQKETPPGPPMQVIHMPETKIPGPSDDLLKKLEAATQAQPPAIKTRQKQRIKRLIVCSICFREDCMYSQHIDVEI